MRVSRCFLAWDPDFLTTMAGKCFDPTALEPGILSTFAFQDSLMRLPIPKLDKTLTRYLRAVQPLVTPTEFERTNAIASDFLKNEGPFLQQELEKTDKSNKHTSYICADWFELYLKDRQPLPVNVTPVLVLRQDLDKLDPLVRAAFWVHSSVKWYSMMTQHTLKPEVFYFAGSDHYSRSRWFERLVSMVPSPFRTPVTMAASQFQAFPLDMSQYARIFGSTRLPGVDMDETRSSTSNFFSHPRMATDALRCYVPHIVVAVRGGHFFRVVVADECGEALPPATIHANLRAIAEMNVAPPAADVGALTSMDRTDWAATRAAMMRDTVNAASLETIDTALFVLALDTDVVTDHSTVEAHSKSTKWMLAPPTNRWWDKSLTVSFTQNGVGSVSFEHSWGDGVAVLRYTQDIFNDTIQRSAASLNKNAAPSHEGVSQLRWNIDDTLANTIRTATKRLQGSIDGLDLYCNTMSGVGKTDPIFKKVKPDPFIQLAFQLAWWRLNHSTVSTYESASTAAFLKGRTEAIRSATNDSAAFTLHFDKDGVTVEEKWRLMQKALSAHATLSKEAKMGEGVDRHLFALKMISQRAGGSTVAMFEDPSYARLGANILSTSTLSSDALISGGFGPVSEGYGVGYSILKGDMAFNISCRKQLGPRHSAQEFSAAVDRAILDMRALVEKQK